MTKVIFQYGKDGSIMFDCLNHTEDHYVCSIVSTLCGVLCQACVREDDRFEPTVYNNAHVRMDLNQSSDTLREIFGVVEDVMHKAAMEHPNDIKIY